MPGSGVWLFRLSRVKTWRLLVCLALTIFEWRTQMGLSGWLVRKLADRLQQPPVPGVKTVYRNGCGVVSSNFVYFINPKINPMTPTKTLFTLTCCFALAALPCAFAEKTGEHSADAMFKSMDTDGDGRVSRAEHAASATKMFDEMDANHDGIVTAAEMTACHEKKGDKHAKKAMSSADMIKTIDTNGDIGSRIEG